MNRRLLIMGFLFFAFLKHAYAQDGEIIRISVVSLKKFGDSKAGFDFTLCAFHTRPEGKPLEDELAFLDDLFQYLNRIYHITQQGGVRAVVQTLFIFHIPYSIPTRIGWAL